MTIRGTAARVNCEILASIALHDAHVTKCLAEQGKPGKFRGLWAWISTNATEPGPPLTRDSIDAARRPHPGGSW